VNIFVCLQMWRLVTCLYLGAVYQFSLTYLMVIIVIVSGKSYRVVMMQDDADWRTEQLVIHVVYCQ